jgi:hypothetical protein
VDEWEVMGMATMKQARIQRRRALMGMAARRGGSRPRVAFAAYHLHGGTFMHWLLSVLVQTGEVALFFIVGGFLTLLTLMLR